MITKHGSAVSDGQRREAHQLQSQATFATNEPDEGQCGEGNQLQRQAKLELDKVCHEQSLENHATESHDRVRAEIRTCGERYMTSDTVNANLEHELVRDNESYMKKVEIDGEVSMQNLYQARRPYHSTGNAGNVGKSGEGQQLQRQATIETDQDCHDQSLENHATETRDQAKAAILTYVEPMKTPDNVNASLEYELVRDKETYTDEMNDRKVKGEKGNLGKYWFQSYVQSLHGAHRVARFDITNKKADLYTS